MLLIEPHLWRYAGYRAYLNLIGEASRYYLGWLWWFLEPLAMAAVFYFVFTYLRGPRAEHFPYFLIIGVTTWLWFNNAVANSTDCLMVARSMIAQMRLPKLMFPLTVVVSASLKHAFVFSIVLVVSGLVLGASAAWVYLPVLLATQLLLILAVASAVALCCCWIRDLRLVVRSGLTLLMFCSGIFFPIDRMPPAFQEVLRLNPMAVLIEDFRTVLLAGMPPDLSRCAAIAGLSLLFLYAMKWTYVRTDRTLTRRVIA